MRSTEYLLDNGLVIVLSAINNRIYIHFRNKLPGSFNADVRNKLNIFKKMTGYMIRNYYLVFCH